MITQMNVRGLLFDPYTNAYIVILRDEQNADMLPIWVGKYSAEIREAQKLLAREVELKQEKEPTNLNTFFFF